MSLRVTVSVSGVNKVVRELDLRIARVRQAVKEQVAKSALNIQLGAKKRCPVRTGALRNSITVDFYGALSAEIGPHMPYAAYVEYGTRKMRAQPYLFPAFEEERLRFEEGLARAVKGAVE
jgi:HK97 gp10 family phage protein